MVFEHVTLTGRHKGTGDRGTYMTVREMNFRTMTIRIVAILVLTLLVATALCLDSVEDENGGEEKEGPNASELPPTERTKHNEEIPVDAEPVPYAPAGAPTAPPAGAEEAVVDYVKDGDTFQLMNGDSVRIVGLNTPESNTPWGPKATARLEHFIGGRRIWLEAADDDIDRYGRLLRYVYTDTFMVNLQLLYEGWAHYYAVGAAPRYSEELLAAERDAIDASRGIWQWSRHWVDIVTVHPDAEGHDTQNLNDEYICLRNPGNASVSLGGWTVKDEATNQYTFSTFQLAPGATITLRTGSGSDTSTDRYWGSSSAVWNNAGDTVFVRDENGYLVDLERY